MGRIYTRLLYLCNLGRALGLYIWPLLFDILRKPATWSASSLHYALLIGYSTIVVLADLFFCELLALVANSKATLESLGGSSLEGSYIAGG